MGILVKKGFLMGILVTVFLSGCLSAVNQTKGEIAPFNEIIHPTTTETASPETANPDPETTSPDTADPEIDSYDMALYIDDYFVRAWDDFIKPVSGVETRNARRLFVDLDGDGEEELLAYKELWAPPYPETNIWIVTPYLCVFDLEKGKEISALMEVETYDLFYSTMIYVNPLNQIIISEYATEGFYEYVICAYKDGVINSQTEIRNGFEPDNEHWQDAAKLNFPPGSEGYPMRYLGLGTQHWGDWDDDFYLYSNPLYDLVDDSD